jgi:regulator of protease activity HflC (stomatin/prohibitin superfamily)
MLRFPECERFTYSALRKREEINMFWIGWLIVFWLLAGAAYLKYGRRGSILFFGKKTGLTVGQGWVIVPLPFTVVPIDCRQIIEKLDALTAKTKDNVTVNVDGSYVWQIVDLTRYLETNSKTIKKGLDDARDQEIRHQIRQLSLEQALDLLAPAAKEAEKGMAAKADEWGIRVSQVFFAGIKVDPEVDKDLQNKKKEQLQKDAQTIEHSFTLGLRKKGIEEGLTPQEALQQANMATGKLTKTVNEQQITVDENTASLVANLFGRKS